LDRSKKTADLKVVYYDPKSIKFDPNNARKHSDDQIDRLRASIKRFGFTNPVLIDEKRQLIAGEARTKAAILNKLTRVPTITLVGLDKTERAALALADNQLPLLSTWNADVLTNTLGTLRGINFDMKALGFDLAEQLDTKKKKTVNFTVGAGRHLLQIEFKTEAELRAAFEQCTSKGWDCKVLE
jgi:ParB family chromosome partitioning protein